MGIIIEEQDVRAEFERKIVIGLIVSTNFCVRILPVYKPIYLEVEYARIVSSWVKDYFDIHKKAPNKTIQDIFEIEKFNLESSIRRIVFRFLISLSKEFIFNREKFNTDYYFKLTADYFDQRETEILFDQGQNFITAGRFEEAKSLLDKSRSIKRDTAGSFKPFDLNEVRLYESEAEANRLFSFSGDVGKLFGHFQRSWLVSIVAPEKRGKSWWLLEIAFQALIRGLNVFFFSLEMNKHVLKNRIYKRLCALPDKDALDEINEIGYLLYPVFDCELNQSNKCGLAKRESRLPLYTERNKPVYRPDMNYKPCVYCRTRFPDKFQPTYWFKHDVSKSKLISSKRIENKVSDFIEMYGDNFVVESYPALSANSDDIQRSLDYRESKDGFIPDVIIDDYFDIHDDEVKAKFKDERGTINTTWKMGKNIADTRCCLYVTADQAVKIARKATSVTEMHTSEDKRKDAHVDEKIAINQVKSERLDDVMRLSVIYNRHRKVIPKEVMVLQKLSIAQPLLDSQLLPYVPEIDDDEDKGERQKKKKSK